MTHIDKVLFASTYLIGLAFDWFKPILRDYTQYKNEQQQDIDTQEVFTNFNKFKRCLERTFGDLDEAQNTKHDLEWLKQRGSASNYASWFLQIISHLDWDDDAYIHYFERGLRPEVQEKLLWQDQPDDLQEYISTAVKIDNWLYEFNQQKQDQWWTGMIPWRNNNYQGND